MPQLTIITAIADYREEGQHLRSLNAELDGIREALRPAVQQGICTILPIAQLTVEKIVEAFAGAEHPVVGFHFAGHAGNDRLILQEDAKREGLAAFLGRQQTLQFVFLNGCSSAGHIDALHRNGVPAVIATEADIPDEAARNVAVSFYRQLGVGKSLDAAFAYIEAPDLIKKGPTRGIRLPSGLSDRLWQISYKEGAREKMSRWSLAIAAGQPLFDLPDITGQYDLPTLPFRYLERYDQRHTRIFFGRGKEIRTLYEKITDPHLNPILLFHGASGVGKSSLLEAGVLPRLRESFKVCYLRRTQESGIINHVLQAIGADQPERAAESWQAQETEKGKPLLLVLDQLEEIFTRPNGHPGDELAGLVAILGAIFENSEQRPRGKVLLSFRKEYFTNIIAEFSKQMLTYTSVPLAPMEEAGIEEAVTGLTSTPPLKKQYGLQVEQGLPQMIADDLLDDSGSSIAPMLQIILTEMWNASEDGKPHFTIALYRRLKRDGLQLADFLRKKMETVEEEFPQAVQNGLVADLLNFFTTSHVTAAQHREETILARYEGREPLIRQLLNKLRDQYLLSKTTGAKEGEPTHYRLAHDTLAPVVRHYFNTSDRPGQLAQRIVESSFLPGPGSLLNERQLHLVLNGKAGMRAWTKEEGDWIEKSRTEIRRQKRIRKLFVYSLAVAGLLLVGLLFWAYRAELRQRKTLESQTLEARADLLSDTYPTRAVRLLQRAQAILYHPDRQKKICEIFRNNLLADTLLVATQEPELAAIAPDGRYLFFATPGEAGKSGITAYAHTADGLRSTELELPGTHSSLHDLVFSADGLKVFGGGKDHQLHQWQVNGSTDTTRQYNHPSLTFHAVAPDRSGDRLATITEVNNKRRIEIRRVVPDTLLSSILLEPVPVALKFAPDDRHLIVGTDSGAVRLHAPGGALQQQWPGNGAPVKSLTVDRESGQVAVARGDRVFRFAFSEGALQLRDSSFSHSAGVEEVVFSSDAHYLLIRTSGQSIHLRRLEDDRTLYTLKGHDAPVLAMGFAETDREILTVDKRGVVCRWPLPALSPRQEIADLRRIRRLVLQPEGETLLLTAIGGGRDVHQWNLPEEAPLRVYDRHEAEVTTLECRAGLCASGDAEGDVHLWSTETGAAIRSFSAHEGYLAELALSPDGRELATTSANNEVHLWSVETGEKLGSLPHPGFVSDLAYAPGGGSIWTLCTDRLLRIWPAGSFSDPITILLDSLTTPEQIHFSDHTEEVIVTGAEGELGRLFFLDRNGQVLRRITLPEGPVNALAESHNTSPAGYALGMNGGRILLMNTKGDVFHEMITTDGRDILSLAWYGKWLVSGSDRGRILLWENADRRPQLEKER